MRTSNCHPLYWGLALLSKEKVRQEYETAESASGKDRERKPGLASGIVNAILDAFAAHSTMSEQTLDAAPCAIMSSITGKGSPARLEAFAVRTLMLCAFPRT
jgi:hypothetical protein